VVFASAAVGASSNLARPGVNWSATESAVTYGSSSSLSGLTNVTPANINSSLFAFALQALGSTTDASITATVYQFELMIYTTAAAPLPWGRLQQLNHEFLRNGFFPLTL